MLNEIRQRMMLKKEAVPIFLVYFVFMFATTIPLPISSIFIRQFLSSDAYVGLVVGFFALEWVVSLLLVQYLLKRFTKREMLLCSLGLIAISFSILPFVNKLWQFLCLYSIITLMAASIIFVFGLFIRESAAKRAISVAEGISFTLLNVTYIIGPLLGGFIAESYGIGVTFIATAVFSAIAMLLALFFIKFPIEHNHYQIESIAANIKDYFSQKNLAYLYIVSCGIITWWIIVYTYMPLFWNALGISKSMIGVALALFVVPLVLFEFPAGLIANKNNYGKLMAAGFIVIAFFLFLSVFANNFYWFCAGIAFACLGAAFIEPLREAYLFSSLAKNDEARMYSVYATSAQSIRVVAPLIFSGILFFSANNYRVLYVFTAIIMLVFAIFALLLKKPVPRDI